MASVRHRQFEEGNGATEDDLRPYFFRRTSADVLEEAFGMLLTQARQAPTRGNEPQALREQWKMLFEHDREMQRLFKGDVEEFYRALEHPEFLHEKLKQLRELQRPRHTAADEHGADGKTADWDDGQSPAREWEHAHDPAPGEHHNHQHGDGKEPSLDDDPIYDRAFRWTCRVDRWSRRLYFQQQLRDDDLFRVFANAALVPAKVAFGFSAAIDDDVSGFEVAVIGYRQASVFLARVIEALGNCYGKRIGREQTAHNLLDEGRELLADIEMKVAELVSEIRYRRSHGSGGGKNTP